MAKVISVHSFRGGTGKSNIVANVAALLAAEGKRVGVVDTDIQSPGIHILFGLPGDQIDHALNDYLWGKSEVAQTVHDVTANVGEGLPGQILLIPASIKAGEISRILKEGYDPKVLATGLRKLIDDLSLDVLMVDTHPGLNEETLLSIVLSQTLVVVMRPDAQDYEGTGVTMQVARKLGVPDMALVVNKVPAALDLKEIQARVEQAYDCPVAAVLPHSDDLMALASNGILSMRYPDHPLTALFKQVASRLTG